MNRAGVARQWRLGVVGVFLAVLVGCGGGGGGGEATGAAAQPAKLETVTGDVQGQLAAAQVSVYKVSADGVRTPLGTTTTDAKGHFVSAVKPADGDVLLVEVTGGQYLDTYQGARVSMPMALRATVVWHIDTRVAVTVYAEAVVRGIEARVAAGQVTAARVKSSASGAWTAATLAQLSAEVVNNTLLEDVTNASLVDLSQPVASSTSNASYALSASAGSFDHFVARVAPGRMAVGMDLLYKLLLVDNDDDELRPPYYAAIDAYVQTTSLDAEMRNAVRAYALLYQSAADEAQLAEAVPRGQSSGQATISTDARPWTMLGQPSMASKTLSEAKFNQRGALVVYDLFTSPLTYRGTHTASVADVLGDADVAVGRWHGGTMARVATAPNGDAGGPQAEVVTLRGEAYALVKAPSSLPGCGQTRMPLWGTTASVAVSNDVVVGAQPEVSSQGYAVAMVGGQAHVGMAVSVRTLSGASLQFTTSGGAASAWRSAIVADAEGFFEAELAPVGVAGALADLRLAVKGRITGEGGTKLVMWQRLSSGWLRVVTAKGSELDSSYCTVSGVAGTAVLTPIPRAGDFVLEGFKTGYAASSDMPHAATFGSRGQLLSYDVMGGLVLGADANVYDLYGDDQVSIGRVAGNLLVNGAPQLEHSTYLIGTLSSVWPNGRTGPATYSLQHATQAVFRPGGTGAPLGRTATITSAVLTISYDEVPWYGRVRLQLSGTFEGQPFTYAQAVDSNQQVILGTLYQGGALSLPGGKGFVVGAQAQRVGLHQFIEVEGGQLEVSLILTR